MRHQRVRIMSCNRKGNWKKERPEERNFSVVFSREINSISVWKFGILIFKRNLKGKMQLLWPLRILIFSLNRKTESTRHQCENVKLRNSNPNI